MNSIKASKPLDAVALDFMVLEHYQSAKEDLLVIMDVFTKITVSLLTADQSAITVEKMLIKEWIPQ